MATTGPRHGVRGRRRIYWLIRRIPLSTEFRPRGQHEKGYHERKLLALGPPVYPILTRSFLPSSLFGARAPAAEGRPLEEPHACWSYGFVPSRIYLYQVWEGVRFGGGNGRDMIFVAIYDAHNLERRFLQTLFHGPPHLVTLCSQSAPFSACGGVGIPLSVRGVAHVTSNVQTSHTTSSSAFPKKYVFRRLFSKKLTTTCPLPFSLASVREFKLRVRFKARWSISVSKSSSWIAGNVVSSRSRVVGCIGIKYL